MAAVGQEGQFALPRLSGRSVFSDKTFRPSPGDPTTGKMRRKGSSAIFGCIFTPTEVSARSARFAPADHAVLQLDILPTAGLDRAAAHLAHYLRLTPLSSRAAVLAGAGPVSAASSSSIVRPFVSMPINRKTRTGRRNHAAK